MHKRTHNWNSIATLHNATAPIWSMEFQLIAPPWRNLGGIEVCAVWISLDKYPLQEEDHPPWLVHRAIRVVLCKPDITTKQVSTMEFNLRSGIEGLSV